MEIFLMHKKNDKLHLCIDFSLQINKIEKKSNFLSHKKEKIFTLYNEIPSSINFDIKIVIISFLPDAKAHVDEPGI